MKILIVDDDLLVRIGLKSIINWEESGFTLVGEANDGCKALELVRELHPDIVITDIKMPVMDGLEMMRRLRELGHPPRVLVLSSYDDFHMVKEAMKLGAEDYLLKLDIEPHSLIGMLTRLSAEIEEKKHQRDKGTNLDNQLMKNMHAMRKNFLRDVLNHFYASEKDLKESMAFLNICLDTENVYCFMIKIGELYRFEDVPNEELHVLNFSIVNISEEIVNDDFYGYCFEGKTGEFFVLASGKRNQNSAVEERKLVDMGTRLCDMLEQYLNITATIGIGQGKGGIRGIHDACDQALHAVKCRFFRENSRVILWKDIASTVFQPKDNFSVLHLRERLHKALSFHQEEELEHIFREILKDVSALPLSKNAVGNIKLELFYMVSEFAELYQLQKTEMFTENCCTYPQLIHADSLSGTRAWIRELEENLLRYVRRENEMGYSKRIGKAKKYMEDHYNEDISLREVADAVNLNPSYFSTVLKRYTGVGYSDYITQLRVEKAKRLLEKSDCKVYEIGEKVGYENIYYFNRIFKKVTGLSPGEFRKKAGNLKKV